MPSAGSRVGAGPGLRSLLGLAAVVYLAAGCATTSELRGRLQLPAAGPARAVQISDAVIYVVPERAAKDPAPASKPASAHRKHPSAEPRTVRLTADGFAPRVLPVTAGSPVRFVNRDHVFHNPFSVSPACRFSLKGCAPGQERSVVFDTVGVANLYCELHPSAAGFVVVRPDKLFTSPRSDGRFTLSGLRPGSYVVKAWHPDLGETSRRVKVTGGHKVDVDLAWSR
jgi:plastocyanin